MLVVVLGALYDALPLVPLVVALVWTLRFQKVADLSLAGSFSIAAGLSAFLLDAGLGVFLSITAGLLVGAIIGLLMGLVVNAFRIDSLLSGLIVLFISYAVSLGITQGTVPVPSASNPLDFLLVMERSSGVPIWAHPYLNLVFLGVGSIAIIGSIAIFGSEWGCAYRALEDQVGGVAYLRSLGLSPSRLSSTGFVLAAILSSTSGMLIMLRDGQATSSLGIDSIIEVIPAYVLGIALFEKRAQLAVTRETRGKGKWLASKMAGVSNSVHERLATFPAPLAASLGVVVFFFIINVAQRYTGITWLPRVLIGLAIVLALGLRPLLANSTRKRRQAASTKVVPRGSDLIISNLSVSYPTLSGPLRVLDEWGMAAKSGHVVKISGRNGSGKSTLLLAIADKVDSDGEFTIPIAESGDSSSKARESLVAYIPQHAHSSIARTLSVAEHATLAFSGTSPSIFRKWAKTSVLATNKLNLDGINLDYQSKMDWLSGGELRRVLLGLLRARKSPPIVITLDEPFSHLDEDGRTLCKQAIKDYAAKGHIMLLIDHGDYVEADDVVFVDRS